MSSGSTFAEETEAVRSHSDSTSTSLCSVTTSWDDGHPLDLRLAELLSKYGLPGTFYIPLRSERAVLGAREVRSLSQSFEIGGHTVNHCDLRTASNNIARREIADCKIELEQITGIACTSFCFPYGHFRRYHLGLLRAAGYRAARTVELMSLSAPRMQDGLLVMPTTVQAIPTSLSSVVKNSAKRWRLSNLLRFLRVNREDWDATAETILGHALTHGGVFHLWGHSWEIEECGQWENLERIFSILAGCKGKALFLDNCELAARARH